MNTKIVVCLRQLELGNFHQALIVRPRTSTSNNQGSLEHARRIAVASLPSELQIQESPRLLYVSGYTFAVCRRSFTRSDGNAGRADLDKAHNLRLHLQYHAEEEFHVVDNMHCYGASVRQSMPAEVAQNQSCTNNLSGTACTIVKDIKNSWKRNHIHSPCSQCEPGPGVERLDPHTSPRQETSLVEILGVQLCIPASTGDHQWSPGVASIRVETKLFPH